MIEPVVVLLHFVFEFGRRDLHEFFKLTAEKVNIGKAQFLGHLGYFFALGQKLAAVIDLLLYNIALWRVMKNALKKLQKVGIAYSALHRQILNGYFAVCQRFRYKVYGGLNYFKLIGGGIYIGLKIAYDVVKNGKTFCICAGLIFHARRRAGREYRRD